MLENKETIHWVVVGGLSFDSRTPKHMIELLIKLRADGTRVRFHWGDQDTGEDWGEIHDVEGRVYASTGPKRVPILVHSNRSHGGTAMLTNCIVKVEATRGNRVLYQHPFYHVNRYELSRDEGVIGGFLDSLHVQEVH